MGRPMKTLKLSYDDDNGDCEDNDFDNNDDNDDSNDDDNDSTDHRNERDGNDDDTDAMTKISAGKFAMMIKTMRL